LYHAFDGETYEGWSPRDTPFGAVGMWVNDDVEEADETDELDENTESLSEFELPVEVEGCENGRSRGVGGSECG